MGMFDEIHDFTMECPQCKEPLNNFQTKDGDPSLEDVSFKTISKFYALCKRCGSFVTFTRKPANSIDDYEMSIEESE